MLNLENGEIEFNGVLITPNCTLADFEQYAGDKVEIIKIDEVSGSVRFVDLVGNNGVNAQIEIDIDEEEGSRVVEISPIRPQGGYEGMLEDSKKWLEGVTIGEYTSTDEKISGTYEWGTMYARHYMSRDYGLMGGTINIEYKR